MLRRKGLEERQEKSDSRCQGANVKKPMGGVEEMKGREKEALKSDRVAFWAGEKTKTPLASVLRCSHIEGVVHLTWPRTA